jgi:Leucine-rich repeat (LRR) protein
MSSVQQWMREKMSSRIRTVVVLAGIIVLSFSAADVFAFQCADVTEIPAAECEALQDLYNNTNGANWQDNTGWLVTDTPCSWFGVVCENGKLTEVHLAGNGLLGQLPESVGDLSDLEYLNVNDNELTGTVPDSIGHLTELQGLWVGGNQITGIPDSIGDCSQLTHLELRHNQVSSIPSRIGELTGLTHLTLHYNPLTDASIPAGFANLSLLTILSFQKTQLTRLPAPVSEMTNLTFLDLSWNKPMESLEGIGQLTALETLHLDSTELTQVPEEIVSLVNLKELWLSGNFLTQFPSVITQLTSLEILKFKYNPQMSGELPLSLVNLTQMKEFTFDGTELCVPDDAGLQAWLAGIATVESSGKDCPAAGTSELEKAVRVMRMLTGHEGTCTDLDVDGSGKVESSDAVLALKQAAGGDDEEQPTIQLSLMVATGTDSLELAWLPANHDGSISYDIHLSEQEEFTPSPATFKKTVTGTTQAEITDLEAGKLYFAVIVAGYGDDSEENSNILQAKTFQNTVTLDASSIVVQAEDLGLGKYTTDDDITYIFFTGTPPATDNILIAEDVAGGITLRRVVSAAKLSDGSVSVVTSEASLTDVFDRGSIYSSAKLFDVQQEEAAQDSMSKNAASGNLSATQRADKYNKIDWKNNLLSAEQINFSYQEDERSVTPQGSSSVIAYDASSSQQFTANVTAKFKPTLITEAEWGGYIVKELRHAKIAAKGTLSLEALAKYNFSASGQWEKDWQLWKKTWTSVYLLGPSGIPVYQEITLKMNAEAIAYASAEVKAQATASISKSIEIGATFDGYKWTPFITPDDQTSFTASMDIVGRASAQIRLVPSIEVRFYKVASASLTIEPSIRTSLLAEETTNNTDFLTAHPDRSLQLSDFSLYYWLNSYLTITLSGLGMSWDVLPPTCMIGEGCLYNFEPLTLFSSPSYSLKQKDTVNNERILEMTVIDGTNNTFSPESIEWEVFPEDASITSEECTKSENESTCTASFTPGEEDEYTVFASGYGILDEIGRQFDEVTIDTRSRLFIVDKKYLTPCYSNGYATAWITTDNTIPIITDFSVVIKCEYFERDDEFPFDCIKNHDNVQNYQRDISFLEWKVDDSEEGFVEAYNYFSYPVEIPLNGNCYMWCSFVSNTGGYDDSNGIFGCGPEWD